MGALAEAMHQVLPDVSDARAEFAVDGIPYVFTADAEAPALFAELMLEANLQTEAFFAKEPEKGNYILVLRLALPTLDVDAFDAALESHVNQAETWRRLLSDFRPVVKAAAERVEEAPQFGASGFVQV